MVRKAGRGQTPAAEGANNKTAEGAAGALGSPDGGWYKVTVEEKDTWNGKVFIGSRDGSLSCLGDQ